MATVKAEEQHIATVSQEDIDRILYGEVEKPLQLNNHQEEQPRESSSIIDSLQFCIEGSKIVRKIWENEQKKERKKKREKRQN